MVVAQLVEQTLPTPEIRSLNQDIDEILTTNCTIEKTKIKQKWPGMAHLFLKISLLLFHLSETLAKENGRYEIISWLSGNQEGSLVLVEIAFWENNST